MAAPTFDTLCEFFYQKVYSLRYLFFNRHTVRNKSNIEDVSFEIPKQAFIYISPNLIILKNFGLVINYTSGKITAAEITAKSHEKTGHALR